MNNSVNLALLSNGLYFLLKESNDICSYQDKNSNTFKWAMFPERDEFMLNYSFTV